MHGALRSLAVGSLSALVAAGASSLDDADALLQVGIREMEVDDFRRERSDLDFVHDPQPATAEAMRAISPKRENMVLYDFNKFSIYGYPAEVDQSISGQMAKGKMWEGGPVTRFCEFMKSLPQRADFFDVGANLGTWSVPIAGCIRENGHGGKVIAVEALKPIAQHLEASVMKNELANMTDVFNYAVGAARVTVNGSLVEAPDQVAFNFDGTNKGGSSIVKSGKVSSSASAQLTTLDSILRGRGYKIAAMKMDIEGYEGQALRGATQFLKNPPCMLSVELNRPWLDRAGTPVEEVAELLTNAGFVLPVPTKEIQGLSNFLLFQKDMQGCMQRFGGTWPNDLKAKWDAEDRLHEKIQRERQQAAAPAKKAPPAAAKAAKAPPAAAAMAQKRALEQQHRAQADRERREREKAQRQKQFDDKQRRERQDRERLAQERQHKAKVERDRLEHEKLQRQRREQQERERREREKHH